MGPFHDGRLHGGVISAVLDAVGGGALMRALCKKQAQELAELAPQRFAKPGPIDWRVDFWRRSPGQHFVACAEITRLGGRVGSTPMRLRNDDGLLIATRAAAYIVS